MRCGSCEFPWLQQRLWRLPFTFHWNRFENFVDPQLGPTICRVFSRGNPFLLSSTFSSSVVVCFHKKLLLSPNNFFSSIDCRLHRLTSLQVIFSKIALYQPFVSIATNCSRLASPASSPGFSFRHFDTWKRNDDDVCAIHRPHRLVANIRAHPDAEFCCASTSHFLRPTNQPNHPFSHPPTLEHLLSSLSLWSDHSFFTYSSLPVSLVTFQLIRSQLSDTHSLNFGLIAVGSATNFFLSLYP